MDCETFFTAAVIRFFLVASPALSVAEQADCFLCGSVGMIGSAVLE